MRRTTAIVLVASCLVLGGGTAWAAAEVVGVYVGNPAIAKYVEAAEALRRQLPAAQARWNDVAATGATFTMAFLPPPASHRIARPCDGVPIRVQVAHGRLTAATYAGSAAQCPAGAAVKAADDPRVYSLLSPASLFQEISSQVERGVHGQACVDASFDADFGLPTTLQVGCPGMTDPVLRIQISDIVSTRQQFWNRAATLAGAALVLLGLAYYHYRRVRRRREAMPGLLLR